MANVPAVYFVFASNEEHDSTIINVIQTLLLLSTDNHGLSNTCCVQTAFGCVLGDAGAMHCYRCCLNDHYNLPY